MKFIDKRIIERESSQWMNSLPWLTSFMSHADNRRTYATGFRAVVGMFFQRSAMTLPRK
jgi:hypothetical protein